MNCSKYLWPMVFASVIAGCSFTGGNAPITDGSATASVYTVKPGDTLYAISSRYGLDPAVVARENHLTNPSHLLVGQKLRLSVSSSTDANIRRVEANTKTQTSSSVLLSPRPLQALLLPHLQVLPRPLLQVALSAAQTAPTAGRLQERLFRISAA